MMLCFSAISYSQGPGILCDVTINTSLPPAGTCTPKTGYNLILEDHFNSFNAAVWDKSSPGDDRCGGYQNPAFCTCSNETPLNESNVIGPSGGILRLRIREGEDMNACDYSGGEIKTFNNIPDLNPNYRSWKVNAGNYVEARVKVPNCEGVGGAFWLRGATSLPDRYFEIDVFEYDYGASSVVKSNVHYGPLGSGTGCNNCAPPENSLICNQAGFPINMTSQFLTFGVEVTGQAANLFINDVLYQTYQFSNSSPYNRPVPFDIRLNGSDNAHNQETNPSNCNNLPQFFDIDYVRVFQKAGTKAVKFTINPAKIALCANNQCVTEYCDYVKVNYFPGVTYQWDTHPNFTISNESYNGGDNETFKIQVAPGTPPGTYQLTLRATFPCSGYQEVLPLEVKVQSGIPPTPTGIFLVTDEINFYYAATNIMGNATSYEWSVNGGAFWANVPNPASGNKNIYEKLFKASNAPRQVTLCVRAKNACGVSPAYCQTITIPAKETPCPGCLNSLVPPREIIAVQSTTNPQEYQLRVAKSPYSLSYDWSFDRQEWNNVDNTNGTLFNFFGPVEAGLDSFMVHVRAKNADTESGIYSQKVSTMNILPRKKQDETGIDSVYVQHQAQTSVPTDENAPVTDEISSRDTEAPCFVYNMLGQLVFQGNTSIRRLQQELETGTYLLVQNVEDPKLRTVKKLVVNR